MNYANNRFYSKGVELQMNSNSFGEAKRNYEYSCMLCCSGRGIGAVDCAHCPVREALLTNGHIFESFLTEKDKEYLRKERELL